MIFITEVGPRDGLQNEKRLVPTDQKVELLERLVESGVKKIEAVSFVNPKVIPQMADAEEVLRRAPRNNDVLYAGLVLSRSGLERALKTDLDLVHIAMATSNSFNQKNAQRTVSQSVEEITKMITDIRSTGKPMVVCLGTAFGCPFEGDVPLANVFSIAEKFIEAGCTEITLADTVGVANPKQVRHYVGEFIRIFGSEVPLGLHFHNTRGLGIVNAYAGYLSGVRRFDASIGGLGGCPFAPKAVGNVSTEDLVNMFEEMGVPTDIELSGLIETAKWLEVPIGHGLDGMLVKAGLVKH